MRSSWASPHLWVVVVIGLLFAVVGEFLTSTITSDWKFLFYTMKPGGFMIAGFFAFCALSNFVGTQFVVDRPFTTSWPSLMIFWAAIFAVVSLMIAMAFGIESKFAVVVLCLGSGTLFLSVPAAFFIRGMAVPTKRDQ